MKIFFTTVVFITFFSQQVWTQSTFTSTGVTSDWFEPTTWTCSGACTTEVPTSMDDVVVSTDNSVTIPAFLAGECRNLKVDAHTPSAIVLEFFSSLTITGTLLANGGLPSVDLLDDDGGTIIFKATNTNSTNLPQVSDTDIIALWNSNAPLPAVQFDLTDNIGSINVIRNSSGYDNIVFESQVDILSGTLQTNSSFITGVEIPNGPLNIAAGAIFECTVPISANGLPTSRVPSININGTLNLGTTAYVNSVDFNINNTGVLSTTFNGENQTQGWWYQTNAPTDVTGIDNGSTINFIANAEQFIPALQYGNLNLNVATLTANKTLGSTGTMLVQGDLNVFSANTTLITSSNPNAIEIMGDIINNGSWAPTQLVRLTGTTAQSITGNNAINFKGGLRIENEIATISLLNQDIDIDGTFDIEPSATFNPDVRTVTLSGNIINDGVLLAGSNTAEFIFNGTTAIIGEGSHNFNNVTITNSLKASTGTISIAGDFMNNGSFNHNSGTVIFNGSGQTISGTTSFNNLTINASGTVTNNGIINLYGTFLPIAGGFNTGDKLTVMSTSLSGDGRIAPLGPGFSFSGNITAQRFVNGITDGDWRYFTSPVIGANLKMWLDSGMPITGDFSDASPAGENNVVSQTAPSVFTYNSNTAEYAALTGSSTSAVTLENGRGYSAYTYVDRNLTLSVTGSLPTGNIDVPLTSGGADLYNLIGNPYPSPVDWDAIHAANSSLGGTVYIRKANNVYASYSNGVGSEGPSNWGGEILMGQSFWVENSGGAAKVTFSEDMKTPVGNGQFFRKQTTPEVLRVKLYNNDQSDETVVYFKEGASEGYESRYDGKKFTNGLYNSETGRQSWMNLSTYNFSNPDQLYVFNALDNDVCQKEVGLVVNDVAIGQYTLEFNKYTIGDYQVKLIDNYAQSEIIISEGASYDFEVTDDIASFGADRFKLAFETVEVNEGIDFNTTIDNTCGNDFIAVQMSDSQSGVTYQLKNAEGEIISNPEESTGGMLTLYVNKANLKESLNSLSIIASGTNECSGSAEYINVVEYDYNSLPQISTVTNGFGCDTGSSVTVRAEGAPEDGFYRWYKSMEATTPIPGENQDELTINGLTDTQWLYVTAVNADGCESERMKVVAEINNLEKPVIIVEGQSLTAPAAEAYQWYNGDELIEGATDQKFHVSESGNFKVEVFEGGCSQFSEAREFIITGVDDMLYKLGLNIYPNPVSDRLNFSIIKNVSDLTQLNVVLFDSNGKKLKTKIDLKGSGQYKFLPMADIRNGIYILNVESDNKTLSLKILKR